MGSKERDHTKTPFMFHVDDIHKIRDKKIEREYRAYEKMLEYVYKRIMMVEKTGQSDTFYPIPPFIMGMPLYSQEYAINYILHHLKRSGFYTKYVGDSYIYINWDVNKTSKRRDSKHRKHRERQENFEIKRSVSVPEYKQHAQHVPYDQRAYRAAASTQHQTYQSQTPSNYYDQREKDHVRFERQHNSTVQQFQKSRHQNENVRPDFSIDSLRRLRETANELRDYR